MGIIKRMLRRTSNKLLATLGAQRDSRQLVINAPVPSMPSSRSKKSIKRRNNKREQVIPEALLLASKNYLPPVQFHHVHGPNAQLSKNKFVARRTQSFCQALVFSNRIILPNERVYIKVLEIAKGWSGTIRFGFTSLDPATLRYQMPKHACPDMTNAGHTWARALADEVVRRNSVIHFSYNTNGLIHYGINNQDCGIFYANVNTSQHLWFIVDIYGLTAAVELIDPTIHTATSELDLSILEPEAESPERSTMYKSTGAMDELVRRYGVSGRTKKKRRKLPRQSALIYERWPADSNLLMTAPLRLDHSRGPLLPNLSSFILPTAQQNIYSPMPGVHERGPASVANETHDYYSIMTSNRNNEQPNPNPGLMKMPLSTTTTTTPSHAGTSNLALNTSNTYSPRKRLVATDEQEISQQLENFQMSDNNSQQQSSTTPTPIRSTLPVAAARRVAQNNSMQINLKRGSEVCSKDKSKVTHSGISSNSGSSSISKAKISNKSRARQSMSGQKSPISRDGNNNCSPSKDCPICFERPINCVLYQCGHMCTCYECGVKQWRTQSRTCPICRTIIKDVIKTYMS